MISVTKIRIYIKLMESRGISSKQLLAGTGVTPKLVSDPAGLLTREMYYAIILNMLNLSNDPGVAFYLGEFINVGDLGIVGYAMLSSETLGQAIRIRQQYMNSLFTTQIKIEGARKTKPGYEMTISSPSLNETLRRFEIEEYFAEGLHYLKMLTGQNPVIRNISFPYSKPSYGAMYNKYFRCPIEFDAKKAVIRVESPDLDTLIPSGNAEFHKVCAQHCQQVMQSLNRDGHLKAKLRDLFLARPGSLPELPAAAASLGMSERNLRRMLLEYGLTYRGLKEEFRLDLSRELLVSGRMAPKEVAYFLGYSTPSGFGRAFKEWTGLTIHQQLKG